ncbi:hypothetical protein CI238_11357 [Colletotrichum incanum]|uniref:Uncharacterized protein n=1 Tax=Colletotrichum incanum TaxID=1573173 RepID=A0A167AZZ8_COLIC|nr:hypothetical protein CI238_11357 [Colletotrichum incanum]
MAEAAEAEIVVRGDATDASAPRRSTRAPTLSTKARETLQTRDICTATNKKITNTRVRTTAVNEPTIENDDGRNLEEDGSLDAGEEISTVSSDRSRARETREMAAAQPTMEQMMQAIAKELRRQRKEAQIRLEESRRQYNELLSQLKETQDEFREYKRLMEDEVKSMQEQLDTIAKSPIVTSSTMTSPQTSYAEIARTPPTSQPSNVQTLSSMNTTPSTFTNTLFCTVDTSPVDVGDKPKVTAGSVRAAIEAEMKTRKGDTSWRCKAVTVDGRNANSIKIVCRDEEEHQGVKQVAEAMQLANGFLVKVDGVKSAAVVDDKGNELPGAAEAFGQENDTTIIKIYWLSGRETIKPYGSIVVYLTKAEDA